MMLLPGFYFLLFYSVLVLGDPTTPVRKCPGTENKMFESVVVSIDGNVCTKLPCNIVKGKTVKSDINFLVPEETTQINMMSNITVMGITINYPLPNATKGCDFLTHAHCPLEPNSAAQLELEMQILDDVPEVQVDLVVYFLNQKANMIACFEFTAQIVSDMFQDIADFKKFLFKLF